MSTPKIQPTSQPGLNVQITPNTWSPTSSWRTDEEREYRGFVYHREPQYGHFIIKKRLGVDSSVPTGLLSRFTNEMIVHGAIDKFISSEEKNGNTHT
jgi:hypothetical protein